MCIRDSINDDVEAALHPIKQNLALYVGGMGAKSRNFHNELIKRMGFEEAAEKIQDHSDQAYASK